MKKRIERLTLFAGALWNIITAAFTIFGYSNWFKNQGMSAFVQADKVNYLSASLLDSLVSVIMIFGLFMLLIGVFNLFIVKKVEKEIYNKKIFIWLIACTVIHFISFDVVGVLLYLITTILYRARYQAYKLAVS